MREQRKEIITNEILYWKANKMLPPHYCDYLLALYNEGEAVNENPRSSEHLAERAFNRSSSNFFSIIIIWLALISLVVFNFTELSIILQTAFLSIFVVFLLIQGLKRKTNKWVRHIAIITAVFILLLQSLQTWESYFSDNLPLLFFTIGIQCVVWMVMGWKYKLSYLSAGGFLGMAVLMISIYQYS
ncbi:hypothetical protein P6709_03690 [Jeotgalibacillus sp. ET6]|uniref:hypothetical protein n=1 Tax=Jeotgalibacillus sp. ET6 TaxID=3037260 RepID=UPI00241880F4|nr:hypothetical protein [Jeotgalibacillus sp. ET6]MDG5470837.1 hypothetical protein [Jeotgalibacillus sp. ET6]